MSALWHIRRPSLRGRGGSLKRSELHHQISQTVSSAQFSKMPFCDLRIRWWNSGGLL